MENITVASIVEDVVALMRHMATGTPPKVRLSPEIAALLTEPPAAAVSPPVNPQTDLHERSSAPEPARAPCPEPENAPEPVSEAPALSDSLSCIASEIAACKRCPLHKTRTNTVPGEGNPRARLVFIGEGPGADEDRQGRPFVGAAGKLLTDIITKGMHLHREEVYICNVVKCRPPNNRIPAMAEVNQCEPYLIRQLEAIQPTMICALGAVAAQTLLKTNATIKSLRGKWHDYHGTPLRVTYHPAYLLRYPADKRLAWEDIQEIMKALDQAS